MLLIFFMVMSPEASAESEWIRVKMENIIPLEKSQAIQAISIGIGKDHVDVGEIELTASISPHQTFDRSAPVPMAWSGSVTNRKVLNISRAMDAFIAFRAGFVVGDRDEKDVDNLYYPFLEISIGMQLYRRISKQSYVAITPEFGFIPGAPYTGSLYTIAAPTVGLSMAFGRQSPSIR